MQYGIVDNCTICAQLTYGVEFQGIFFCASCWVYDNANCISLTRWRNKRAKIPFNSQNPNYPGPLSQSYYSYYSNFYANYPFGGDSEVAEIKFSNGDTEEWTKLELKGLTKGDFNQALSILKLAVANQDKNWDSKRNCWFVRTSLVDQLKVGFEALAGALNSAKDYYVPNIYVLDKREKYESFDEFFTNQASIGTSKIRSKDELIKAFGQLLDTKFIPMSPEAMSSLDTAKKLYRKAALALHPDRNNGDGTKMSELNMIWNELQRRF